ncbi:uncharacterized protein LOC129129419 isoform X1 [Agelaius phoeniceus]|uniref:uncharacterized protein LOC129129419 isoform X1 n=1 Tax=Agelaius phoeniceus TaxID=39638 RepID=UPI004054CDE7
MLKCRIKLCKLSELKSSSGRSPEPRRGQWIVNTLLPGALGLPPCWYRRRSQRWQLQGPVTGLADGGQLPAVPLNTRPTYRITSSPPRIAASSTRSTRETGQPCSASPHTSSPMRSREREASPCPASQNGKMG